MVVYGTISKTTGHDSWVVDEIDTEDHQSFFLAASNKIGNTILSHIKALCGTFFHVYMRTNKHTRDGKYFLLWGFAIKKLEH